jgi:RNA polymerase sigma-70 factor (ECF subfamily)
VAWLYGIARHKLVDHYRLEERHRRHFGRPVDIEAIDIGPSPPLGTIDLDDLHTRNDVIATLSRLQPRQRAALVLRYLDGCAVDTVAAHLEISLHAAESLLARARVAFRRAWLDTTGEPR